MSIMKPTLAKGFNKIFNRLTITVALILIQMGWLGLMILQLATYAIWIYLLFIAIAALMCLFIVWRDDNPAYKMGWILLVCLLPVLGVTMYVFFGNKRPSKSLKRKIDVLDRLQNDNLTQEEDLGEIMGNRLLNTVNYIGSRGPYPAWTDTASRYYALGDDAYPDMLEDLAGAEHFIFMEYFIIAEGEMWNSISEILKRKAAEGVDVRLIYDDLGSINTFSARETAALREEGVKVLAFNPLKPFASLVYNNRDHRKILVVDGHTAYSGGFNLADEYINRIQRFGHWKDTGIRIRGHAVWNFTVMFLKMWNSFRPTEEDYSPFRPHVHHPDEFGSDGIIQPYADSPLDDENIGENVYLEILSQAEDYVYIFTPYLIIDNEMKTSLELAAKRGVDVRIVTPAIPDKKTIFRLSRSYYRPLMKAGVRIYEYTPGFMHAKSYLSDDKIGVVGTINMDYRSLFLHFECGTLLIGCQALYDLKKDCEAVFGVSREMHQEDCRRGFFGVLADSLLRVLSPLL